MSGYLEEYGAGDERRGQIIKRIVGTCVAVIVLAVLAYFLLKDHREKSVAKEFLADVNGGQFEKAYRQWGCTPEHPCRDYSYQRFLEDWGPQKKVDSPWKIGSTDSCTSFLTVNVQATGAETQSIMVEKASQIMGFAPAPECQEYKWRWRAFFKRIFKGQS